VLERARSYPPTAAFQRFTDVFGEPQSQPYTGKGKGSSSAAASSSS